MSRNNHFRLFLGFTFKKSPSSSSAYLELVRGGSRLKKVVQSSPLSQQRFPLKLFKNIKVLKWKAEFYFENHLFLILLFLMQGT